MKVNEVREMSDEQVELTLKETAEKLFRLKFQSQTERLDAPSEIRKCRRLIARIKTVQTQRAKATEGSDARLELESNQSQQVKNECPSVS